MNTPLHNPENQVLETKTAVSRGIPPEHDIMKMTVDEVIEALNRPWPTSDMPLDQQIQLLFDVIEKDKRGGI